MSAPHIKQELVDMEPVYKRPVSSQLIAYVRLYPFLYDKRHPAYKDSTLKQARWSLIAAQMGVTVEQVKIRWKSLRDRYIRDKKAYEIRKQKAQKEAEKRDASRPTWSLYNVLAEVLDGNSCDEMNNVTIFDQSLESYPPPTPQSSFDEDSENSIFSELEQPGTSTDLQNLENPKKRKLDCIENRLCSILQTTYDRLGEANPRPNLVENSDEAYLYAMSLVPRFRTYSKRKMLQARYQIEKILFELDDED